MEWRAPGGRMALVLAGLFVGVGGGCNGTEQQVFAPVPVVSVPRPKPPPTTTDSGAVHMMVDAGPPVMAPDAGGDDDAGKEPTDPDLDPTKTFVWTETLPGQGTCRSGVYAGSFDCDVSGDLGALPISLSGQIAFTLEGSSEIQTLTITDGSISEPPFLMSGLSGALHCIPSRFEGTSVDGHSVSIGDQNNPFVLSFPNFDASLQGQYDSQALVISGDFTMVSDTGYMCTGTFRVSATP